MVQPDYATVSTVILSYPERYYNDYDSLVPFYDSLISLIPNDYKLWIITNNNQSIRKLQEKFAHKQIEFLGLRGWDEIWLRDCIGFNTKDTVIKPVYSPAYCNGVNDVEYYKKISGLSKTIIKECFGKEIHTLPLLIDGGNFVCNDSHVFLTDKVYEQNSAFSSSEIDRMIQNATGLRPVVAINNQSDSIGHMDAYLSFLSNDKATLATYPSFPFLKSDISFIKNLQQELDEREIEVVEVFDRPIDELAQCGCRQSKGACFYSARGNYVNFLRLNNTIILPEYTLPTQKETQYYNKLNQQILEELGFEVLRINCDKLSKLGGALHCISLTM